MFFSNKIKKKSRRIVCQGALLEKVTSFLREAFAALKPGLVTKNLYETPSCFAVFRRFEIRR